MKEKRSFPPPFFFHMITSHLITESDLLWITVFYRYETKVQYLVAGWILQIFFHNLDSKTLRNEEIHNCSPYHDPMVNHLHCEKLFKFEIIWLQTLIVFASKIKKSSLISSTILPERCLRTLIKSPPSFVKQLHSKLWTLHCMALLLSSLSNRRLIPLADSNVVRLFFFS